MSPYSLINNDVSLLYVVLLLLLAIRGWMFVFMDWFCCLFGFICFVEFALLWVCLLLMIVCLLFWVWFFDLLWFAFYCWCYIVGFSCACWLGVGATFCVGCGLDWLVTCCCDGYFAFRFGEFWLVGCYICYCLWLDVIVLFCCGLLQCCVFSFKRVFVVVIGFC